MFPQKRKFLASKHLVSALLGVTLLLGFTNVQAQSPGGEEPVDSQPTTAPLVPQEQCADYAESQWLTPYPETAEDAQEIINNGGVNSEGKTVNPSEYVKLGEIEYDNPDNCEMDFTVGLGKAGQIYSLNIRGVGELIPPQWRQDGGSVQGVVAAPWVDEVMQVVVNRNSANAALYSVHQGGTYLYADAENPPAYLYEDQTVDPNYFPMAAAYHDQVETKIDEANRLVCTRSLAKQSRFTDYIEILNRYAVDPNDPVVQDYLDVKGQVYDISELGSPENSYEFESCTGIEDNGMIQVETNIRGLEIDRDGDGTLDGPETFDRLNTPMSPYRHSDFKWLGVPKLNPDKTYNLNNAGEYRMNWFYMDEFTSEKVREENGEDTSMFSPNDNNYEVAPDHRCNDYDGLQFRDACNLFATGWVVFAEDKNDPNSPALTLVYGDSPEIKTQRLGQIHLGTTIRDIINFAVVTTFDEYVDQTNVRYKLWPTTVSNISINNLNDELISSQGISSQLPELIYYTPQAQDITIDTYQNSPATTLNLEDYVSDEDGDIDWSKTSVTTDASGGTVEFEAATRTLSYTPDTDFSGTDIFTIRVYDSRTEGDSMTPNFVEETVEVTVASYEPGITTDQSSLSFLEGESTPLAISLAEAPQEGDVVLSLSDNLEGVTLSTDSLTFTPENWNQPQSVTLTSLEDDIDQDLTGTLNITVNSALSDPTYLAPDVNVGLSVTDNDTAGVVLDPVEFDLAEGASQSVTARLTSEPVDTVTLQLADTMERTTISPASVTFTATNWSTDQTFVVAVPEDDLVKGASDVALTLSAASSDSKYAGVSEDITVSVGENDTAELTLNQSEQTLEEGESSNETTVVLSAEPTAPVSVTINSDYAELTVAPETLTFNASNWNTPQAVTLTAVEDEVDRADFVDTLRFISESTDDSFDSLNKTLPVSVTDNDTAGTVLSSESIALDEGTSETVTFGLTSQPTAETVFEITSSQASISVAPQTLAFNANNWYTPQTLTLTASADDNAADETGTVTIQARAANADTNYNSGSTSIAVQINDTNTPSLQATLPSEITEGQSTSFDVALSSAPSQDVVLEVISSQSTLLTASPSTVSFNQSNWNQPQSVTVNAPNDSNAQLDEVILTVRVIVADSDDAFAQTPEVSEQVRILDSEAPGIVTNPTTLSLSEGASSTVAVSLTKEPSDAVTVTATLAGPYTVTPATLNFDTSNWNTTQTVRVDYPENEVVDTVLDQTLAIVVEDAQTSAQEYQGLRSEVSLTGTDNDEAEQGEPGFTLSTSQSDTLSAGGEATVEADYQVGATDLTNAVLKAKLADEITYVNGTCQPECSASGQELRWNLGNLPEGQIGDVRFNIAPAATTATFELPGTLQALAQSTDWIEFSFESSELTLESFETTSVNADETVTNPSSTDNDETVGGNTGSLLRTGGNQITNAGWLIAFFVLLLASAFYVFRKK